MKTERAEECSSCDSLLDDGAEELDGGWYCRFCKHGIYDDQSIYLSKLVRIMGAMLNELAKKAP